MVWADRITPTAGPDTSAQPKTTFHQPPVAESSARDPFSESGIALHEKLPDVDAVFVAVGGGGPIAGIASVLKARNPDVVVYGWQPEASAVMARPIEAAEILDLPSEPTLSDGTASH